MLQRNVDVVVDPVPGHEATKGVPQARQLNDPLQSSVAVLVKRLLATSNLAEVCGAKSYISL